MDELSCVEDSAVIVIRPYDAETDKSLIYASWRNSAYYSAALPISDENSDYFKKATSKIKTILKTARIRVACLEDCPMVIIGYVVTTGAHLDWIYVKSDWRQKGIATLLVPKDIETVTSDLTKIGLKIAQDKNLTIKSA